MDERIRELADWIAKTEEARKQIAEKIRVKGIDVLPDALERGVFHTVAPKPITSSVAAVDGGLLAQEFHGFDLMLSRSLAVVFNYDNSKLASYTYHPSALPPSEVNYSANLDLHEFAWHKNLFRLQKELAIALDCVEKKKPNYMFLDGSVVPQMSDRPPPGSEPRELYDRALGTCKALYSACESSQTKLVGVIKDSRGKRFIELLDAFLDEPDRRVLQKSNDASFLHFLLGPGERTPAFSYSSNTSEHPVLRDLGEWGSKINAMYLKPVHADRPLRVEFLNHHRPDEIASTIHSLSAINAKYAYPAVLIEADLRAALNPIELERTYRDIFVNTGLRSSLLKLRRDSRPFR